MHEKARVESLIKKKHVLNNILLVTMDANICGRAEALLSSGHSQADIEAVDMICEDYITLYEMREAMFEEIYKIDSEFDDIGIGIGNKVEIEDDEIIKLYSDIVSIDKKNSEMARKLTERARDSVRLINMGKTARNLYER